MIYYDLLARQYVVFLFLVMSYLEMTGVQLNTVEFWGAIADRHDQDVCSLMEFAFIHKQK